MRFRQLPVTLGMQIRAIRLGFFTIGNYYMRLSRHPDSDKLFRVELHPLSMIDGRAHLLKDRYIVWWEGDNLLGFLQSIKPLQGVVRVKKYISFLVNDLGEAA